MSAWLLGIFVLSAAVGDAATPVADRARQIHGAALLVDGHNDLPWILRKHDPTLTRHDLRGHLDFADTDIPRLRAGGVKAQFWSAFIPSSYPHQTRSVLGQIDLIHRLVERYRETFELALTADDVERIARSGKIAALIGVEGGAAIEHDLAVLRTFHRLGVRYLTLTHNQTTDWADAATDVPKHNGLSPFGEQVIREMNRLGMLVDIAHVSPATMTAALRVSQAPVIASHSNAYAVCPHPRNIPDGVLQGLRANGGVVMVNFYSDFIEPELGRRIVQTQRELQAKYPDPAAYQRAFDAWYEDQAVPATTISQLVDHIDHIVRVAGLAHVGIGSDFDGITGAPDGLDDVSCFPRLTEELLRRGYDPSDIPKILGGNILRALRQAGEVARTGGATPAPPDPPPARDGGSPAAARRP